MAGVMPLRRSANTMPRIAIVGSGALGARHLQALARIRHPLAVDLVDPFPAARERAQGCLAEAGGLTAGSVQEHASVGDMPCAPDVAIVATTSRERRAVVTALIEQGTRFLILEKVLFPRLADYDEVAALLERYAVAAWVNCPRRGYPGAGVLRACVSGGPFEYRVEGVGWGLASNVIHHLDEASMLAKSTSFTLSPDALHPETAPARRPGYVEFFGTLTGSFGDHVQFTASCESGNGDGNRRVVITCAETRIEISQVGQVMKISDGGKSRTLPFPLLRQSETTNLHVAEILEGRAPDLPDFATAAMLHKPVIEAFLAHLRRSSGDSSINECPIT
jgi:hypothetical protein